MIYEQLIKNDRHILYSVALTMLFLCLFIGLCIIVHEVHHERLDDVEDRLALVEAACP